MVPGHDHTCNGHDRYAPLPSDEPVIEYIPTKPLAPAWRKQLAPVTWSFDFKDPDGNRNMVVIRTNTASEAMAQITQPRHPACAPYTKQPATPDAAL